MTEVGRIDRQPDDHLMATLAGLAHRASAPGRRTADAATVNGNGGQVIGTTVVTLSLDALQAETVEGLVDVAANTITLKRGIYLFTAAIGTAAATATQGTVAVAPVTNAGNAGFVTGGLFSQTFAPNLNGVTPISRLVLVTAEMADAAFLLWTTSGTYTTAAASYGFARIADVP